MLEERRQSQHAAAELGTEEAERRLIEKIAVFVQRQDGDQLGGEPKGERGPRAGPLRQRAQHLDEGVLAIAEDGRKEAPVVLDIATTVVSYGTIKTYRLEGWPLPEGWMINATDGKPLTDSKSQFGKRQPMSEQEHRLSETAAGVTDQIASFPYEFPKPGQYRIWVQIKTSGKIFTGVFDAEVLPAR